MSEFTIFPVPAFEIYARAYFPIPFSTWMRANIRALKLEEENDYIVEEGESPFTGRRMRLYFLNLEPAKAIAGRIREEGKRNRALEVIAEYDTPENRGGEAFFEFLNGKRPLVL